MDLYVSVSVCFFLCRTYICIYACVCVCLLTHVFLLYVCMNVCVCVSACVVFVLCVRVPLCVAGIPTASSPSIRFCTTACLMMTGARERPSE